MMEPEQCDEFLTECVRAFDENRADDWAVLAGQTPNLAFDAASGQVSLVGEYGLYDLRGYKWLRPVPWDE